MPGYPNSTSVTVTDVMATIDPAVGNVAKKYVWLVNIATGVKYGPSAATDSSGNWSLAAVDQGIYETFYAGESPVGAVPTQWTTAGVKGYLVSIASNPPTGAVTEWGSGRFNVMSPLATNGGARGDGVTDDSAAVTNAYAQRTAQSLPGEVIFPAGFAFLVGNTSVPAGSITRAYGATIKLKASAGLDLLTFANAAHVDTAILGGIWDGNGANQSAQSNNAVINGGVGAALAHNRTRIQDAVVLNAAQTSIFLSEATGLQSNNPKYVKNCVVKDHAIKTGGFGFYGDYCKMTIWEGCWASTTVIADNFELGHLGQQTMIGCVSIGGQIQFPFGDDSRIIGCLQINNTIQNDNNTALRVLIQACTVLNATPAAGYAGICIAGSGSIMGCRIQVTAGNGLQGTTQALADSILEGNIVETLNAGAVTGSALGAGGTVGSTGNILAHNIVFGKWANGAEIIPANTTVVYNILDLTAATATNGVYLQPSANTGILANNSTIVGNQILGSPTTPLNIVGSGNITGTLTRDNLGGNPIGSVTTPGIVTTLVTNNTGVDCMVFITTGGTNTVPQVNINGVNTTQTVPLSTTAKLVGVVCARGTIQLVGATLAGTSWLWVGAS